MFLKRLTSDGGKGVSKPLRIPEINIITKYLVFIYNLISYCIYRISICKAKYFVVVEL